MEEADNQNADTWLAYYQTLVQLRQAYLLQGIFDILNGWHKNGVPVYPMAT